MFTAPLRHRVLRIAHLLQLGALRIAGYLLSQVEIRHITKFREEERHRIATWPDLRINLVHFRLDARGRIAANLPALVLADAGAVQLLELLHLSWRERMLAHEPLPPLRKRRGVAAVPCCVSNKRQRSRRRGRGIRIRFCYVSFRSVPFRSVGRDIRVTVT